MWIADFFMSVFRSLCFSVNFKDSGEIAAPLALFTGDTLFLGGCGRFFEGSGRNMWDIVSRFKAKLSLETVLFVGHDYTKKNLQFASMILKFNQLIQSRIHHLEQNDELCGLWKEELTTNIFVMSDDTEVQQALGTNDPISTISRLRELKDNF